MSKGGYDHENDPSPDVYSVRHEADGAIEVRHFRSRIAKDSCCFVTVTVTADDRADPEVAPEVAALGRAYQIIEKKHAKKGKKP